MNRAVKKSFTRFLTLVGLLALLSLILIAIFLLTARKPDRILMLDWIGDEPAAKLLSMNSDDSDVRDLGPATGAIDWLQNGKGIFAVGCADKAKVCVYQATASSIQLQYQLDIPTECDQLSPSFGVKSINWSSDGSRLAILCNNDKSSNLCIIGLDGKSTCWGERSGEEIIVRSDWSPVNDELVIDPGKLSYIIPAEIGNVNGKVKVLRRGGLQIVNEKGELLRTLLDGWSPSWSPDGKWIAFFRWNEEIGYPGIGIMDPNGENFRWVFLPPSRGSGGDAEYYHPGFRDYTWCSSPSKISWSSDEKYLYIDASQQASCWTSVYRIEVKTGEITSLMDDYSYYREVDVGP